MCENEWVNGIFIMFELFRLVVNGYLKLINMGYKIYYILLLVLLKIKKYFC